MTVDFRIKPVADEFHINIFMSLYPVKQNGFMCLLIMIFYITGRLNSKWNPYIKLYSGKSAYSAPVFLLLCPSLFGADFRVHWSFQSP